MELKLLTYKQARLEFFEAELIKAKRSLVYHERRFKAGDSPLSPQSVALDEAAAKVSYYTDVVKLLRREIPQKVTHEATLYKCCTCPNCKNVVDEFTEFSGNKVRVTSRICRFCGQALDWSEV